jgi:hypothetical protein
MPFPRIIGVCGYKRNGKDTVAQHLATQYGYTHVKFAQPLKTWIQELFQLTQEQVEGAEKDQVDPAWGVSPRQIMQFMGTEVMQFKIQELLPHVGRTFWVQRLFKELPEDARLVISDVRFQHEVDEIRRRDPTAVILRVERQHPHPHGDVHVSEVELLNLRPDVCIPNDGTIKDLWTRIDAWMAELLDRQSNLRL